MRSLRTSDLEKLPPDRRDALLTELVQATQGGLNGELGEVEARVRALEVKYGIDSEALRGEVSEGRRQETEEVCHWLMLLKLRDRLAALTPRSR